MHIYVASVVLRNADGHLLVVRKRGTSTFMQPGGKPEAGEAPAQTAVREVAEELEVHLDPTRLTHLGHWSAPAANEPGWTISSDVFTAPLPGTPRAAAEIEELRWIDLDDPGAVARQPLAPLLTEHVIPALRG